MILCHCAAVTDSTVEQIVAAGATTVGEVTRRCGAGKHCAPCREEIAAILYADQAKRQNSPTCGAVACDRRAA